MVIITRRNRQNTVNTTINDTLTEILDDPNDYYRVLGVKSTAKDSQIRKAYRQRSLLVHPNKCKDPRANEAQQAINIAWASLNSPVSRNNYDLTGTSLAVVDPTSSPPLQDDGNGFPLLVVFLLIICVIAGIVYTQSSSPNLDCLSLTRPLKDHREFILPNGRVISYYIEDPCSNFTTERIHEWVQQLYVTNLEHECHWEGQRREISSRKDLATISTCREIFELRAYL